MNDYVQDDIKISRPFKRAQRKVNRAYFKAVFFFVAMISLEQFFPRYRDFNTLRRTTIIDVFGFIEGINEIPLLGEISFAYGLIGLSLLLLFPVYLRGKDLKYDPTQEKKQIKKLKGMQSKIDTGYYAAVIGFAFVLFNTFFISLAQVSGVSMEPQFFDQDDVIIHHQMSDLSRGDIVVVKDPDRPQTYIVKRIIGLPGETVEVKEGRVFIDDVALNEDYLLSEVGTSCNGAYCNVVLSDDEYYVLGDNRSSSNDSRRLGTFEMDDLLGEVVIIVRPFDRAGRVQP
jgi:signal peptidase I